MLQRALCGTSGARPKEKVPIQLGVRHRKSQCRATVINMIFAMDTSRLQIPQTELQTPCFSSRWCPELSAAKLGGEMVPWAQVLHTTLGPNLLLCASRAGLVTSRAGWGEQRVFPGRFSLQRCVCLETEPQNTSAFKPHPPMFSCFNF